MCTPSVSVYGVTCTTLPLAVRYDEKLLPVFCIWGDLKWQILICIVFIVVCSHIIYILKFSILDYIDFIFLILGWFYIRCDLQLYKIILYSIIVYHIVLYYILLYFILWYKILYYIIFYKIVLYSAILHCVILDYMTLGYIILYYITLYYIILYCFVLYFITLLY